MRRAAVLVLLLGAGTFACTRQASDSTGADPRSARARDDDAVLELALPTPGSCRLVLSVEGRRVPLSHGDRLFLRLEADGADRPLWSEDSWALAEEVAAGALERRGDCSSGLSGLPEETPVRAAARVEKAACWLGCLYDRPRTRWLPLPRPEPIFSDGFEDGAGGAWDR